MVENTSTVWVINAATNAVIGSPIPVGSFPISLGISIPIPVPLPPFGGTSWTAKLSRHVGLALAQQFGSLNAAAIALKFASVQALQNAITVFCAG